MQKPGIKPIKQIKLGTKWRALVPKEYQDDVCPILSPELVEKLKCNKKNNAPKSTTNTNNEDVFTDPLLKMTVKQLKQELEKLKLPKSGVKNVLINCLREVCVCTELNLKQEEN